MGDLILPRRQRDRLGRLHDDFLSGEIESYVVVAIQKDGATEVNFDLHDSLHMPGLNKMGGGLSAAIQHVRDLAIQQRDKDEAARLPGLPGGQALN